MRGYQLGPHVPVTSYYDISRMMNVGHQCGAKYNHHSKETVHCLSQGDLLAIRVSSLG
jgi:hypothetical protein